MPEPDTSNGLPVSGGSEKDGNDGRTRHWHGDSPGVVTPSAQKGDKVPIREAAKNLAERLKIIALSIGEAAGMVTHQMWSPLKRKKEG